MKYAVCYFIVISFFSVLFTVADKWQAKNGEYRIPEKTLFFMSLLGGSLSMFITMLIIRHKTRKMCFMVGLPFIFLLQCSAICLYYLYV